jgi:hypothetical protein
MQDASYSPLGCLDGVEVGVQATPDGQDILIRKSDIGLSLAHLLTSGKARIVRRGESIYWRIPHDRQVDRLIVELIDLFISIRYAHPTMVQLELALSAPSISTVLSVDSTEGSDSEGMILESDPP